MKVYPLERPMLKRLKPLVANYQFKPYNEYKIEQSLLESYVIDEISDILSREENFVLVAEEMGKLIGLVSLERLDWDTKHFGIEMAKIGHLITSGGYSKAFEVKCELISHMLTKCCQKQISHLSARVYKEDLSSIHALESKSFRLMGIIVTHSLDIRKRNSVHLEHKWHIREFELDDVPKLANIAMKSFKEQPVVTDRFHADSFLPKEKSDDVYVQWIINSCKGLSDTVLVAEMNGTPVGFTVCKVYKSLCEKLGVRFGAATLIAVTPSARGKTIHTSLLNAALQWFDDKVDIVEVGAQINNYAGQRAWSRLGFKIIRSQCTFHCSAIIERQP